MVSSEIPWKCCLSLLFSSYMHEPFRLACVYKKYKWRVAYPTVSHSKLLHNYYKLILILIVHLSAVCMFHLSADKTGNQSIVSYTSPRSVFETDVSNGDSLDSGLSDELLRQSCFLEICICCCKQPSRWGLLPYY